MFVDEYSLGSRKVKMGDEYDEVTVLPLAGK